MHGENGHEGIMESGEVDRGTMYIRKGEANASGSLSCPKCRLINPPENAFCSGCGLTLRELEIKDQRGSLEQGAHERTMAGREAAQPMMRRTSTYLGKLRRVEPIPTPAQFQQKEAEKILQEKSDNTVMIVGIFFISLLVVVVIVLVLVLVKFL